jgi:hypothetical protein
LIAARREENDPPAKSETIWLRPELVVRGSSGEGNPPNS